MEQIKPNNICTYWPANPAFDLKGVLFRHLFFYQRGQDQIHVCRALPHSRLYTTGRIWDRSEGLGPKTIILSDEHVDAMAEGLPMLRDAMSGGNPLDGIGCKGGVWRLHVARSPVISKLYFDTHYISLTLLDIENFSRLFIVVQQQLRDYVVATPDVLPYVSNALTSVTYVDPCPNAGKTLILLTCTSKLLHSSKTSCLFSFNCDSYICIRYELT
jgi:hypothetical protein